MRQNDLANEERLCRNEARTMVLERSVATAINKIEQLPQQAHGFWASLCACSPSASHSVGNANFLV